MHHSTKLTLVQASEKVKENIVFLSLQDKRRKRKLQIRLGQFVRIDDNKKNLSRSDSIKIVGKA